MNNNYSLNAVALISCVYFVIVDKYFFNFSKHKRAVLIRGVLRGDTMSTYMYNKIFLLKMDKTYPSIILFMYSLCDLRTRCIIL